MLYPITVEVLHQVFSPYGFVEKIVTFQKSAGQPTPLLQLPHLPSLFLSFTCVHACTYTRADVPTHKPGLLLPPEIVFIAT